jgi:hypothetical protein
MRIPALKVAIVPTPESRPAPTTSVPTAPAPTVFDHEPDFSKAPEPAVSEPAPTPAPAAVTPAQMAGVSLPIAATTTTPSAADVLGAISSREPSRTPTKKHHGISIGWIIGIASTTILIVVIALQFTGKSGGDPLTTDPFQPATGNGVSGQPGLSDPDAPTPPEQPSAPRPATDPRPIGSKPEGLAVLESHRDIFAGSGFAPAGPDREFWKIQTSLMAHEDSITLSPDTDITLEADGVRGRLTGWVVNRRQLTPVEAALEVPKGLSQTITFVFDLPAGVTPEDVTLTVPGAGEIQFDAPSPLPTTAPREVAGEYYEVPPRNLKPLESNPLVAAIQNASQGMLLLTTDGDELEIDLPDAHITGEGKRTSDGLYRVVLTDGDDTHWAQLRLAGPDRVVLYLSDAPYSQLTFARNDAEDQLPALPTGLVSMTDSDQVDTSGRVFTDPASATDTEAYELFKDSAHQPADREGFFDY